MIHEMNQEAFDNFTGTMSGLTRDEALFNVALDAKAYGWNTLTVRAIQLKIRTWPVKDGVLA